ncbi:hypothetical protein PTKIN_Ptkin14bG0212600 [Pterospermum kingtungense]
METEESEIRSWRDVLLDIPHDHIVRISLLSAFQKTFNILWGENEELELCPADKNLFVVQFPNFEMRDQVLEKGPWHVKNQPLIVRKWSPNLEALELNLNKMPIWVHLKAERKKLEYSRVCIELDINKKIPKFIEVVRRSGKVAQIEVIVPWMSIKCEECKLFGHSQKYCSNKQPKSVAKVWKPNSMPKEKDSVVEKIDLQLQDNVATLHSEVVIVEKGSCSFDQSNSKNSEKGKNVVISQIEKHMETSATDNPPGNCKRKKA